MSSINTKEISTKLNSLKENLHLERESLQKRARTSKIVGAVALAAIALVAAAFIATFIFFPEFLAIPLSLALAYPLTSAVSALVLPLIAVVGFSKSSKCAKKIKEVEHAITVTNLLIERVNRKDRDTIDFIDTHYTDKEITAEELLRIFWKL